MRTSTACCNALSLVMTIYHDQYLLSVKNRTYTNRYEVFRNFIHVIIKRNGELAIIVSVVNVLIRVRELKDETWLIERDMAIRTDTTQEQVYATDRFHEPHKTYTQPPNPRHLPFQRYYVLRFDIDMTEEIIPHERMIAFG